MSSRYEGLPMVLLEAMACGLPIISTDCPSGPTEILEKGKYGMLVPVEDEHALSEAMISLLRDQERRIELSEKGLRRIMDFSISRIIKEYENLLSAF